MYATLSKLIHKKPSLGPVSMWTCKWLFRDDKKHKITSRGPTIHRSVLQKLLSLWPDCPPTNEPKPVKLVTR